MKIDNLAKHKYFDVFSKGKILEHLRVPLYRNAYALVASTGITSLLGIFYWMLAARNYPTEVVGMNSAMIYTMIFLANISQFQLVNALNRFLPSAGRSTIKVILFSYILCLGAAFIASLIFVSGIDFWAPGLSVLKSNSYQLFWFIFSTMVWVIFVLQDGVLIGLRQAIWVPVENIFFALAKIILVVIFASVFFQTGIFVSWTLPVAFLLLPINLLIFWRLVPRHIETMNTNVSPFSFGQIFRFVSIDYFSSLIWMGTTNLMPLIIVNRLGASAAAYFSLSWLFAYMLYLLCRNIGMSLIAEASSDPSKLLFFSSRILNQTSGIIVPAVTVVMIFAPLILRLYGENYSLQGTLLLRLLVLSAIPYIITSLFISIARVQRRMFEIALLSGVLCVMVLSLSHVLIGMMGVVGIGVAWLVGQTAVAGYLLATRLRAVIFLQGNLELLLRIISPPRNLFMRLKEHRLEGQANALYQKLLAVKNDEQWIQPSFNEGKVIKVHRSLSDVSVLTIGVSKSPDALVMKLPRSMEAEKQLLREKHILEKLCSDERLGDWYRLLPQFIASGRIDGKTYFIEKNIPGLTASELLMNSQNDDLVQAVALSTIYDLHRRTATTSMFSRELEEFYIDRPLHCIQSLELLGVFDEIWGGRLEKLNETLRTSMHKSSHTLSWTHGDYWPSNILVGLDGRAVTGIVDWGAARPNGLPIVDMLNFYMSAKSMLEKKEIGTVIQELLKKQDWSQLECGTLTQAVTAWQIDQDRMYELIVLSWLQHVYLNIKKSNRYAKNQYWLAKNVIAVLGILG